MKRNKLLRIVALSTFIPGLLSLSSCMDGDINRPGGKISDGDLEGDNYKLGAFFPQMTDLVVPAQENDYQMCENLVGGEYGRYLMFTNAGWSSAKNPPLYNVPTSWYSAPFQTMLPKFYQAYNQIKEITKEEGVNWAWANVLRVAVMQRLTDTYGPIPYSKVNPKSLSAPYDKQEEVYNHMFEDLDKAIETLTGYAVANPSATPMAAYDNVYGGHFTKWVKYANSLKLRMAVRIRFVNPDLARKKAEEAVHQQVGVITSNEDNASYFYAKGNPLNIMWNSYGDTRVCADILTYMEGYKDPRESKYFQNATKTEWGVPYAAMRAGINIVNQKDARAYSAPLAAKGDRLIWMTASEVAFLKAEGALAGWKMEGTAKALYESAVKLSFEQWEVGGADTYLENNTYTQAAYANPSSVTEGAGAPAVSTIKIQWNDAGTPEENLERIITQKWIALWPLGTEAWCEIRRTGYPKVFKLANVARYPIDIPNRLPFSYNEYQNNKTNVEAAVGLLGGEDTYVTRLWWQSKKKL